MIFKEANCLEKYIKQRASIAWLYSDPIYLHQCLCVYVSVSICSDKPSTDTH